MKKGRRGSVNRLSRIAYVAKLIYARCLVLSFVGKPYRCRKLGNASYTGLVLLSLLPKVVANYYEKRRGED
jgi:hypothetical protein